MCCLSYTTWAQTQSNVNGLVTDFSGEPLIGVSILVKGTSNGTVTDLDGKFSLSAEMGNMLQISYVGYISQEVKVESDKLLRIIMEEDTKKLEEVVVIGYGTQKKVNLTGAVAAVSAEDLASKPVMSTAQALAGLAPGLSVLQTSGRPGQGATVKIRGTGTFSKAGTDPLVLIDGLSGNIDDVDPNDIQSISFLKDAASASIYGNRAANGVILIETKKGAQGKTTITYSNSFGWQQPTELPDFLPSWEYAEYYNMAMRNMGKQEAYLPEQIQKYRDGSDPDNYPNVNHLKWLLESGSGFQHQHNLSIQGGNATTSYNLSVGYRNQEGMTAKTSNERMTALFTMKSEIAKGLMLNLNINAYNNKYNAPNGEPQSIDGMIGYAVRQGPIYAGQKSDGSFGYQDNYSPEAWLASESFVQNVSRNISASGQLTWNTPVDGLSFIGKVGMNYWTKYDKAYRADTYFDESKTVGPATLNVWTANNTYTTFEALATYEKQIKNHTFKLLAGTSVEQSNNKGLEGYRNTFPNNYLYELGSGDKSTATNDSSLEEYALLSFFGRINYAWKDRYLLEVNLRYDGSSRFAKGNRWGFFPSASLGWNITREQFMMPIADVVSNLKLRASYGLLGNQAGAALYTFAATMDLNDKLGNYIFSDGRHIFTKAPAVVNPNTTWEKVESKNIGLDFGFFGNSLTGSFDVFQRDTKDMLGPTVDFPDFFGADAPKTNNARMRNRGWELVLSYRGKIGKDIDYSIGGSLSDATAEVTEYEGTRTNPKDNWYKGKKAGEIWGYRADGLIQTQAEADEYNNTYDLSFISGKPWTPGDVKYRDLNGDKKINNGLNTLDDMGDMTVIGNTTPRYQYTINGSISWKGVTVSAMFQGVAKRDWDPGTGAYFWGSGPYAQVTVFKEHLDYWSETNTGAYYPKPYIHTAGGVVPFRNKTMTLSDRYLQSGAYCRLKNLTVSYDIPAVWTKKVGLQKVQVFFSGENLLTFTTLKGMFDPEAIFTKNDYTAEGGKNYPMNKVISFGLVVNL
jgi:TonB-linked SusC/RagA family outer membrane protein